jgi:hypothetical protein
VIQQSTLSTRKKECNHEYINKKTKRIGSTDNIPVILLPASANAFEFTLSGQVNRLIMNVDNGETNGVVNADNSVSGTRVRVKRHGDLCHQGFFGCPAGSVSSSLPNFG